jgi:hypothetical protein
MRGRHDHALRAHGRAGLEAHALHLPLGGAAHGASGRGRSRAAIVREAHLRADEDLVSTTVPSYTSAPFSIFTRDPTRTSAPMYPSLPTTYSRPTFAPSRICAFRQTLVPAPTRAESWTSAKGCIYARGRDLNCGRAPRAR